MPSYTTPALGYIRLAENTEYIDTGIPVKDLQAQISLLNKRIETLEELLLEFGIKKVFDETDNRE